MDSASALSELKNFQGSRKGAGDYYKESQNELGVGDAQARSNDLRGLIRNTETQLKGVGASVAGRTRGFGVNEAQRARLQNLESQPIAEQLGGLQGSFSDAQQNYRDLLGQAGTRAGMSYQTDSDRATALQGNYDRIFQKEQTDAEAARWQQQLAEQTRQWQQDFDARRSQFAAQQQATRDQWAQQASLWNQQQDAAKAAAAAGNSASGAVYDNTGQILGYSSPGQMSFQTDYGNKKQEQEERKYNRGFGQQIFGGIGDITGWF